MKRRFENSALVADWYEVRELRPNLYCVDEQDHVAFFVVKNGQRALFIDSGLGLVESKARQLLSYLGVTEFDVLATHAHCDHAGLNFLAHHTLILEDEWLKYLEFNEQNQLAGYYQMLKNDLPWPADMPDPPIHHAWTPSGFISDGEYQNFGAYKLEAMFLPGHTRGHLVFVDRREKLIFLGDFIVTGTNFIHLKDSSILTYMASLKKLAALLVEMPDALLLPCHDAIPLDPAYLIELSNVLDRIKNDSLLPVGEWRGDSLFEDAWLYDTGKVRITIRKDQLALIRSA